MARTSPQCAQVPSVEDERGRIHIGPAFRMPARPGQHRLGLPRLVFAPPLRPSSPGQPERAGRTDTAITQLPHRVLFPSTGACRGAEGGWLSLIHI
eukprot:14974134-Alexandrium_andersonii.AAC.1